MPPGWMRANGGIEISSIFAVVVAKVEDVRHIDQLISQDFSQSMEQQQARGPRGNGVGEYAGDRIRAPVMEGEQRPGLHQDGLADSRCFSN